jgi:hypothetical protein
MCDLQMLVAAAEGRLVDLTKYLTSGNARVDGADVSVNDKMKTRQRQGAKDKDETKTRDTPSNDKLKTRQRQGQKTEDVTKTRDKPSQDKVTISKCQIGLDGADVSVNDNLKTRQRPGREKI